MSRTVSLLIMMTAALCLAAKADARFSFTVVSDQRWFAGEGVFDSAAYFRGAVSAMANSGKGAFLVSPGDIDPVEDAQWTIGNILGEDFQWYPVVGNHELPDGGFESYSGENMDRLRSFATDISGPGAEPDIVRYGPTGCQQTTYSFDMENAHFVVLNVYCDESGDTATDGDISDHLYTWLESDLQRTDKQKIFVFGHEPAYPQPDLDNGRFRHAYDSLNVYTKRRERFWSLLKTHGVTAYFCGHTHNFSSVKLDGVWQIDSSHARGAGDPGAPSTYLRMDVGQSATLHVFRDIHDGVYDYNDIVHREQLDGDPASSTMSFQQGVFPSSSYSGARDTLLSENSPYTNFGNSDIIGADGDAPAGSLRDKSALLHWDISAVPRGSTIHSVTMEINVTEATTEGYAVYGVKRRWSEDRATWFQSDRFAPWAAAGASGAGDRFPELVGSYSPGRNGAFVFFLNTQGKELVQQWVDDPAGNHGVIITGSSGDGFDFSSSEAATTWKRPKLTVSYSAPPGNNGLPWIHLLLD